MPESTTIQTPAALGDNRGIKFSFKTGNARYQCVLQDRSVYERTKASRQNSSDSVSSTESTKTEKSSH
ncbi:hypothetical protein FVEN_g11445 [Fusarium venenatum]|uniref:Uncharacterized protein n=1 Tax=Fusarium venenatum TaxID=56646 RepID=A0A2L2TFG1_9HYPO|nr:uncharacterized protein FVRRES_09799 [Fusarium venenatum]KAG8350392.1 hypothetical protein FVEN_g11445 [Fusarium venenatum]KAH6966450.1 hypothetical protein EDB82DRAFT_515916 [Fusarium venenatum]CEI69722.1 unnamed protein product [Fusarium venenatum]